MTCPVHPDWDRAGADWPNREASQFLQVGRVRWHYQRMGQGPVLLLLHGTGAATHSWRDMMPLLAEKFDVIALDLPGHGFTRIQSRRQCSLPAMGGAIAEFLKALDLQPNMLIGHSAGTAIALRSVLSDGVSTERVIGFNPALTPFRGVAGVVFPPLAKLLALNPFVPWMFASLPGSRTQARRLIDSTGSNIDARGHALYARLFTRSDHVDGALAMMALWDLDPLLKALPNLDTPIDLYVGEGDQMVPPKEAIGLGRTIDRITTHKVPSLGHLMHEEEPQTFADIIKDVACG
ncbi:MAG: alpha/beta fold hydrolase BchO [Pseudomonadota bacterium]